MLHNYFLVAVSNRFNLDLCRRFYVAGFPSSINGLWAFHDIEVGDFISFLYGARVYGLYKVINKTAVGVPDAPPAWKFLHMRSGRIYTFPFRLTLESIREFEESLVRPQFSFVAENLLLRGGYAKSHFQADQTTLQHASQLGRVYDRPMRCEIDYNKYNPFTPMLTLNKDLVNPPKVFLLKEVVIQALIKKILSKSEILDALLKKFGIDADPSNWEVLGEKALPEGHVDIFIKERFPAGISKCIIVEVKRGRAGERDLKQVLRYRDELGKECIGVSLIAEKFSREITYEKRALLIKYSLDIDRDGLYSFNNLLNLIELEF